MARSSQRMRAKSWRPWFTALAIATAATAALAAHAHSQSWVHAEDLLRALHGLSPGAVADAARLVWDIIGPGGRLHPGWFLEHKGHLVVEGALLVIIVALFMQRPQPSASEQQDELTEKVGACIGLGISFERQPLNRLLSTIEARHSHIHVRESLSTRSSVARNVS